MSSCRIFSRIGVVLAALALLALGSPAKADSSVVPGRSVGRVFLGMERADVWKILGRPSLTLTMPLGMSLYGEDYWNGKHGTLTVISEGDKVIQIEFDSPNFTTADGLSTKSTLVQIHRRHPSVTVQGYVFLFPKPSFEHRLDEYDEYYVDDVRGGIAFQEGDTPIDLSTTPDVIIIHRPGHQAVPIGGDVRVKRMAPNEDSNDLRLLRSRFAPHGK